VRGSIGHWKSTFVPGRGVFSGKKSREKREKRTVTRKFHLPQNLSQTGYVFREIRRENENNEDRRVSLPDRIAAEKRDDK
jgi:hypothetical protein